MKSHVIQAGDRATRFLRLFDIICEISKVTFVVVYIFVIASLVFSLGSYFINIFQIDLTEAYGLWNSNSSSDETESMKIAMYWVFLFCTFFTLSMCLINLVGLPIISVSYTHLRAHET